jgi:hypothetical protein
VEDSHGAYQIGSKSLSIAEKRKAAGLTFKAWCNDNPERITERATFACTLAFYSTSKGMKSTPITAAKNATA